MFGGMVWHCGMFASEELFHSLALWNCSVHQTFGRHLNITACEREKGSLPRPPFSIPAAPREIGASHCAHLPHLRLRPARLDVLSRFASGRHPWRPDLVVGAPARRFQRGHNPAAVISLLIKILYRGRNDVPRYGSHVLFILSLKNKSFAKLLPGMVIPSSG